MVVQKAQAPADPPDMSDDDLPPLLRSLLAAVARSPDDGPLRLHLAQLLLQAGLPAVALEHCAAAIRANPGDPGATDLLAQITTALTGTQASSPAKPSPAPSSSERPLPANGEVPAKEQFDWDEAERQMSSQTPANKASAPGPDGPGLLERPEVRLADVGGMEAVKHEIQLSFLLPMLRPELRNTYQASVGGGLLLYGPPGCGKTFIARALAGELGASFVAVSLADVLDMWLGQSEKNVRALFVQARSNRPAVIFLDEVDAIGQKRTNLRNNPAMRGTVNQLLSEMDGVTSFNDGIYIVAATNQPWDVDPALRRPGRFDRTLFVAPPDQPAREAVLHYHLQGRPLGEIDFVRLARDTDGYSGADLAHLCMLATRQALSDAAATQRVQPIGMRELEAARRQVKPSTSEWFATARHAATFANHDGTYDELIAHLRSRKLW
ncbi:MAG: ATP-binding protein [Acidimicrobiales bacterium]